MTKYQAIQRTGELFDGLNQLVMEWDPYGLSRAGEIRDEFSDEVWALLQLLPNVRSSEDCIDAVVTVFATFFNPIDFTHETCRDFGDLLFRWWDKQP